jgi:hypothetical protein
MARIVTLVPDRARGLQRLLLALVKRQYGGIVPGIAQIVLADLPLALLTGWLYGYLHERRRSPLTRLQREMVATVVNGLIGGAP